MSEEVTIAEKKEGEREREEERRRQYNANRRASYWRHRDQVLECARRRYHSDKNVRRHKLEYVWRYYRNNADRIAAYHKAYRKGMRVRAI